MTAKKPYFRMSPIWADVDKAIIVDGPLAITVDFDDVDHHQVRHDTEKMVQILNKYWDTLPGPPKKEDD